MPNGVSCELPTVPWALMMMQRGILRRQNNGSQKIKGGKEAPFKRKVHTVAPKRQSETVKRQVYYLVRGPLHGIWEFT